MKITYFGLSSFLIENDKGYRVLVDPFNDSPEWTLGPSFPREYNGQPFGANLVLMSEPDADHSYTPGDWLEKAPKTKPNSEPFPNLNLKGTVVYEHNGDLNIAWHYTVDGICLAHFADNAHLLTEAQLAEISQPDVIFISPPKASSENTDALDIVRENIKKLNPKIIIWAHHIAPVDLPTSEDPQVLREYFAEYFTKRANTNKNYKDSQSFISLCYVYENALLLNKEYNGEILDIPSIEIGSESLPDKPKSYLFRNMYSGSNR